MFGRLAVRGVCICLTLSHPLTELAKTGALRSQQAGRGLQPFLVRESEGEDQFHAPG